MTLFIDLNDHQNLPKWFVLGSVENTSETICSVMELIVAFHTKKIQNTSYQKTAS